MRKRRLKRRAFIAGVGGTAVALPWLEIMQPAKAVAAEGAIPCRFLVSMTGTTLAGGSTPTGTGPGFTLPYAFEPFAPFKDYVSIVSGLEVPHGGPGGVTGTAGHGSMLVPLVTGSQSQSGRPAHATSDAMVAEAIGAGTRFPRGLHYRVQPVPYNGGVSYMSATGPRGINGPVSSPRLAYDQLFGGGGVAPPPTAPGNPANPSPSQALDEGRSVLDLVLRRSQRLRGILGRWDRQRLEQHFDEIRALELRLRDIDESPVLTGGGGSPSPTSGCQALTPPGGDPAITQITHAQGNAGYSGEHERGRVLADLIHMAFVCDLTRVATYMIGYLSCAMSFQEILGVVFDAHSLTHSPAQRALGSRGQQVMRDASRWFVDQFAYLLGKLHATPEGSGNMLDHTAAVLLWEHGSNGAHNRDNLVITLAGRPSAIRQGQHIRGNGRHPANVSQTAMYAVGVREPLGEVAGVIDELLV